MIRFSTHAHVVFVPGLIKPLDLRLRKVGSSLVVHIEIQERKPEPYKVKRMRAVEAARFAHKQLSSHFTITT